MKFYYICLNVYIWCSVVFQFALSNENDSPKLNIGGSYGSSRPLVVIDGDAPLESPKGRLGSSVKYSKLKNGFKSEGEDLWKDLKYKAYDLSKNRDEKIVQNLDRLDYTKEQIVGVQENGQISSDPKDSYAPKYVITKGKLPNNYLNEHQDTDQEYDPLLKEKKYWNHINLLIKTYDQNLIQNDEQINIVNDDQENDDNSKLVDSSKDYDEEDHFYYEDYYNEDVVDHGLPDCSEKLKYNVPLLIISTLDGQISGLNYKTGEVIWSHKTNADGSPLLSSSISKLEVTSRGEFVRLIPSLDGAIYQFDGESVEALPITADTLLHSSFKYNEDTIFSGGKYSDILGVLPYTGEIKYTCDNKGCPGKQSTASGNHILVIRRVSQIVRAVDPKSGNERWNFSVGQHEVNLASSGCDSLKRGSKDEDLSLPSLHFVLPDGVVIAVDESMRTIWQQKLPSPIISAWSLQDSNLESIDLFNSNSVPALQPQQFKEEEPHEPESGQKQPALYVGVHRGQLYIQQNINFKNEMNVLLHKVASSKSAFDQNFPKVNWKPYLASADSRTPVINHGASNHPLLLDYERKELSQDVIVRHNVEYPFDNGYYLYDNDEEFFNNSNFWLHSENVEEEQLYEGDITSKIYYICFEAGPSIYWKFAAAIAVYATIHIVLMKFILKNAVNNLQQRLNQRAVATIVVVLQNIFREHPQLLGIIQRMGLHRLPIAPPPPSSTSARDSREGSRSTSESTQRQDSNFSSRYTSDFEPVQCLGKGGFGVVFQVKNKLDENDYAVKRIVLPSKESSAERVKREVRALAKLNHSNIVRYYNSWIESPPIGWEEEADSWWKISGAASSLLSQELDESEQPPESCQQHDPVLEKQPKEMESLSGVVDRLNFQQGLHFTNTSSLATNGQKWSNNNTEDDDDDDEEEEEEEEGNDIGFEEENKEDVLEAPVDDSFEVVFENQAENTEERSSDKEAPPSSVTDDISESCGYIDSREIIRNDYSKLTCHTRSISSSGEGIIFSEKGEATGFSALSRRKSSGAYNNRLIKANRQRNKSLPDRPSSLDINPNLTEDRSSVHRAIVKCPPTPNPRTYLYIQMELCQKESLKEWLFSHPRRDRNQLYSFFNDIVHAVEYVHDRSLMHRDLKPSNIFFSLDGEIKIGDFGLVTTIEDENDIRTPVVDNATNSAGAQSSFQQQQRTLNAGTHLYMSPEQIAGQSYTYKVDIYSLGLIFFEMLVPFSTEMERREVMLRARDKSFPTWFIEQFSDVCLTDHREPLHSSYPGPENSTLSSQPPLPPQENLLQLTLHPNPVHRPTTRGIRARPPLGALQRGEVIRENEHFHLQRQKTHSRNYSGSFVVTTP